MLLGSLELHGEGMNDKTQRLKTPDLGPWTLPNQSTKATKVCRSVSKMVESEDCLGNLDRRDNNCLIDV